MSYLKMYYPVSFFIIFQVLGAVATHGQYTIVIITDYGAIGDGKTINTAIFQRYVDECNENGGTVIFSEGTWLTRTLLIKSGVVLDLQEKAVLLGSTNPDDFKSVDSFVNGVDHEIGFRFISAVDAHDIRIIGKGAINGQGGIRFGTEPAASFENITVTANDTEARPAFIGIDLANISLANWKVNTNLSSEPLIGLESVDNVLIKKFEPLTKPENYLKTEGESNGIQLKDLKYFKG